MIRVGLNPVGDAANEFARWQSKHVKTCFNTFPLSAIEFMRWCGATDISDIHMIRPRMHTNLH